MQLPTLLEYGLQVPAYLFGPVPLVGRPDLNPSIVWNAELDYDRALPAIRSTLRTALFQQRTDDVISAPPGAPLSATPSGAPVYFSTNVGYTAAAGAEFGIKGHSQAGWRWNASYSYVATTDHTASNAGPVPTGIIGYRRSTPQDVVIAGIGYSRDKWEADVMARWQSSFLDYRPNPQRRFLIPVVVENYVTMTARVAYRLTDRLTLDVTAQQFNRSQLIETAGPPVERQIIASLTVHL